MKLTEEERKNKQRLEYQLYKKSYNYSSNKWHKNNKEKVKELGKKWRSLNKEKIKASYKEYYETNKEKIKQLSRDWRKNNPKRNLENNLKWRTRKLENGGTASYDKVAERVKMWGNLCWICKKPSECIDHVIPVSKGGTGWPANLRPACKSCNSRKSAQDWRPWVIKYKLPIISKLP